MPTSSPGEFNSSESTRFYASEYSAHDLRPVTAPCVPDPTDSPTQLFKASFGTEKALPRHKQRLDALEQAVVDAADKFEAAASAAALHTLKDLAAKPVDAADRAQLTNTYTNRFVPDGAPGNLLYNALKKVRHKICPLCGHRDVSTLDHQLPKMKYPLLVVLGQVRSMVACPLDLLCR
ncbi:hypothetical protein [Streptomyces sp. ALB3]|uniref:hypothetical protein n=1 Tax=Streptomyces sp. ALB3 TaxID=3374278 RepID=UPI0037A59D97